jgi:hypothetical protein
MRVARYRDRYDVISRGDGNVLGCGHCDRIRCLYPVLGVYIDGKSRPYRCVMNWITWRGRSRYTCSNSEGDVLTRGRWSCFSYTNLGRVPNARVARKNNCLYLISAISLSS